jgi:hypothetical protein
MLGSRLRQEHMLEMTAENAAQRSVHLVVKRMDAVQDETPLLARYFRIKEHPTLESLD